MVGTYNTRDVTEDEVLGMIISGKKPDGKEQAPRNPGDRS
jgi:D-xylose transport system ATP-binding protein